LRYPDFYRKPNGAVVNSNAIELSEALALGGRLSAREDGFDLTYFEPSSGRGGSKIAFKIDSSMFQAYIAGLADNWRTYLILNSSMPMLPFSVDGKLGMKIESQGVLFHRVHIRTYAEVEELSNMLRDARTRGAELHKEVLARLGRIALTGDDKSRCFAQFKAGAKLGVSTNPNVIHELDYALALVRSKFCLETTSCRYHVANWFGRQAAHEFMEDLRRHGLDVFNELADFVITWNDRE
jgi:hypothetical protein